jgi:AraC family transcriptional regulator
MKDGTRSGVSAKRGFETYAQFLASGGFAGALTDTRTLAVEPGRWGDTGPVRLFRTRQTGAVCDPAVPEFTIQMLTAGAFQYRADFGFGAFSGVKRPGEFDVTAPDMECQIEATGSGPEPQELLILAIPVSRLQVLDESGEPRARRDLGRLHAQMTRCETTSRLMSMLWSEAGTAGPHLGLFTDGALMALGAALSRHAGAATIQRARGGLAPWQARRVTDYLHAHLAKDISLAELAAVADLSSYHFARAFKTSLGAPPHAYHSRLRIQRAKALLTETNLPVTEVAAEVGYDAPQTLARVFRRETGLTPTDFRRRRRL